MNNVVGYINEAYLKSSLNKYKKGQVLKASVLYLEPVSKIVQFTMGSVQDRCDADLQKGTVTSAEVGITTILFKFNLRCESLDMQAQLVSDIAISMTSYVNCKIVFY